MGYSPWGCEEFDTTQQLSVHTPIKLTIAVSQLICQGCERPSLLLPLLSRFSRVQLWETPCQAPLSMGFSRQEYWSGLPCPPSGDLLDPGIEPT